MNELTWDEAFRYLDGLHAFLEETGKYLDAEGNEPEPGSKAALEFAAYPDTGSSSTILAQAMLMIDSVADHAFAMIKTLRSPGQTIAPWTCARAMLEASSISRWLMDVSIDALKRIERSMILRKEGLEEQRKALKALKEPEKVPMVKERLQELQSTAARFGIAHVKAMPSTTDLARDYLRDESSYRIFSAVLHGHSWASTQLGFRRVDPQVPHILEKNLEPWAAAYLIYKAACYFAMPVWDYSQFLGHNRISLKSIFNSGYDSIGVGSDSECRFWYSLRSNSAYS